MKRATLLTTLATVLAGPAFAQAPAAGRKDVVVAPEGPTRLAWYGYGTLACDATAILLGAGAELVFLGTAGYLLCTPVVHAAHGNAGRSALSLGVRAATATVLYPLTDDAQRGDLANLGVLGGLAAVSLLDAGLLAWERRPDVSRRNSAWVPMLDLRAGRATIGVGGAF